jgi:hypothetical protein
MSRAVNSEVNEFSEIHFIFLKGAGVASHLSCRDRRFTLHYRDLTQSTIWTRLSGFCSFMPLPRRIIEMAKYPDRQYS